MPIWCGAVAVRAARGEKLAASHSTGPACMPIIHRSRKPQGRKTERKAPVPNSTAGKAATYGMPARRLRPAGRPGKQPLDHDQRSRRRKATQPFLQRYGAAGWRSFGIESKAAIGSSATEFNLGSFQYPRNDFRPVWGRKQQALNSGSSSFQQKCPCMHLAWLAKKRPEAPLIFFFFVSVLSSVLTASSI